MNMLSKSLKIAQNAWMTSTAFQGLDTNPVYSLAARQNSIPVGKLLMCLQCKRQT
jgi:hypothetical protein